MPGIFDTPMGSLKYKSRPCPNCGEMLPVIRLPKSFKQWGAGGSTCAKCGVESDGKGNIRSRPADDAAAG